MGLEETFGKVEKPAKEKKLEIITSKEATIKDLEAYFEKNKYEEDKDGDEIKEYFSSCMNFLKSFELNPEIISEFNANIRTEGIIESRAFGLYLSTLIQCSYNQGFNNFRFEKVSAMWFGAFLKGQPENPIKITTKTIEGDSSLEDSKHCILKTKNMKECGSLVRAENCTLIAETLEGDYTLWKTKNCTLITKTLKGSYSLPYADGCLAEITNYSGKRFGDGIINCTIKSPSRITLWKLKQQTKFGVNNKFELKK